MPAVHNLVLYKGRTFSESFQLLDDFDTPIDITGATAESQVRDVAGVLALDFAATVTAPTNGVLELSATPAETDTLNAQNSFIEQTGNVEYLYDVVITYANGEVDTLFEGTVRVIQGVTQ